VARVSLPSRRSENFFSSSTATLNGKLQQVDTLGVTLETT